MKNQSILCLLLLLAACAPAQTPTPVQPTTTVTAIPSPTFTPAPTATATSTPDAAATQRSEDFHGWIERLVGMGILPDDHGQYTAFGDFSGSFAEAHSMKVSTMGIMARDFVLQARVRMKSAATGISKAGCGFAFLVDDPNSLAVLLAQDGNVNFVAIGYPAKSNYLGPEIASDPDGNLLTLAVYDYEMHFFVNDKMVLDAPHILQFGPKELPAGLFGPAVLSGTSEGFGTRCDFTEFTGWVIR